MVSRLTGNEVGCRSLVGGGAVAVDGVCSVESESPELVIALKPLH